MSDRTSYVEIAGYLRRLITDGKLVPGDKMPSQTKILEQFGSTPTTVNRAFQVLKAERLTVAKPGVGTVVAERPRFAATAAARLKRIGRTGDPYGYKEKSIKHTAALRSADATVADALGIEPHDEIVLRSRVFVQGNTPTIAAFSCIHMRALGTVPELLSTEPMGRFWQKIYTERTGRTVVKSPERRTARFASQNELDLLEVRVPETVPAPVLILVNVFHDEDGPLEYWEDVYAPGLWQADDE